VPLRITTGLSSGEKEKERKRERERNREKEGIPEGGLKGFKEEVMNKDLHVWKGHTER